MDHNDSEPRTSTQAVPDMDRKGPNRQVPLSTKAAMLIGLVVLVIVVCVAFAMVQNSSSKSNGTAAAAKLPAPAEVAITAAGFSPASITVEAGQAVEWTNQDSQPHVVASDPYPTDNKLPGLNSNQIITSGSTYSYVFTTLGEFTYHDNLHPSLKGTVIVKSSQSIPK